MDFWVFLLLFSTPPKCTVCYSDFHNLMGFQQKMPNIILNNEKYVKLVKPFLAKSRSTSSKKIIYSMYSLSPDFFYFLLLMSIKNTQNFTLISNMRKWLEKSAPQKNCIAKKFC